VSCQTRARIIYFGHDVCSQRLAAKHALSEDAAVLLECERMRRIEEALWRTVDLVLYPTREDCELVHQAIPGQSVCAVPLPIYDEKLGNAPPSQWPGDDGRDIHHLLLAGGDVDDILWFSHDVFPRLREREPRFRITILGPAASPAIRALQSPEISLSDHVDWAGLQSLYPSVGAVVIPSRSGGSGNHQVLDSFAHAVPVVSTTLGLHGITSAADLAFVGNTAAELADGVVEACGNRRLAAAKVHNALRFIARNHCYAAAVDALAEHIGEFRR
jgi:hypothetical protein